MTFKKGDRITWTRAKTGTHYGTIEEPSDYLVKVIEDYGEAYLIPPARLSLSDTRKRLFKEGDLVWCRSGKYSYFNGTFVRADGTEAVIVPEGGGIRRTNLEGVQPIESMPVTPWIGD